LALCHCAIYAPNGFDLGTFGSAPTKFDADDLTSLTARILHAKPVSAVADRLSEAGVPEADHAAFWAAVSENVERIDDVDGWWSLCRDGATPVVADEDRAFVAEALGLLPARPWTDATWGEWTTAVKAQTGRKGRQLFMPLRLALTGLERGPEMARLLPLLQVMPKL